jgi:hypothetical protein
LPFAGTLMLPLMNGISIDIPGGEPRIDFMLEKIGE